MPFYSYYCEDCENKTEQVLTLAQYDSYVPGPCENCQSTKVYRDYQQDSVLRQPQTLGMLADQNASRRGYESCVPEKTKRDPLPKEFYPR